MSKHKIDKTILRKLIKEVLNELEDMAVEPAGKETGPAMTNTLAAEKHKNDTLITMVARGVKPNKGLKKAMAAMAYAAKVADLDIIHGEVEKSGNRVMSMDAGELTRELPDKFKTTDTKSVNRKGVFNKERPEFKGTPEEWKALTDREMKAKQAAKRSGSGPEGTEDWTDAQWQAWEAQSRQANPSLWSKIDASDKARAKSEPKVVSNEPEAEEPEKPVAGS